MADVAPLVFRIDWESNGVAHGHVLGEGETLIGSSAECHVRLQSPFVSRRHATIHLHEGRLEVEDLKSKNGIKVGGQRVDVSSLKAGDTVEIGPITLFIRSVDPDDTVLALPGATAPTCASDTRAGSRTRTETPSGEGGKLAAAGLDALRRALAVLAASPADLGAALDQFSGAVGLHGCAILRVTPGKHAEILARRGDMAPLLELEGSLVKVTQAGRPVARFDGRPDVASALRCTSAGTVWALAGWHDGLDRAVVGPVMEALLDAVLIAQTPASVPPRSPAATSPRGLRLPQRHVPGRSPGMRALYSQMARLATVALPILITGETGVGKEHVAEILHLSSPRHGGPFQAVNCAAIPAELLESELFGIERGVATGVSQRAGKMLLASGGVLFLDEIGDMPMPLQAKLLRAIQEREVLPVGGRRGIPVDVWLLSATNVDPVQLIESGRLRRDLYYRLAGCTLRVPPLRERREDLAPLIEHVLLEVAAETGRPARGVTVKALRALVEAPWPGNVRQLEHEVRRLALLCTDGQPIDSTMLAPEILAPTPAPIPVDLNGDLDLRTHVEALERALIAAALTRTRGNQSKAAELLGISRDGLRLKLRTLGASADTNVKK